MISLGSYSCSAVSVPSLVKGDTLSPSTEETLSPSKWGITLAHFWKEGAEARYPSAISFCIPTVTAECPSQLPGLGPLACENIRCPCSSSQSRVCSAGHAAGLCLLGQ